MLLVLPVAAVFLPGAPVAASLWNGYTGIWYFNEPSGDQYVYKYSRGLATYWQQQSPIAIYIPSQNKTFFCYGGATDLENREGKRELLHMVSYFDHATGMVPRPTQLLNKQTDDAHDNPVMSIDEQGHIWIFCNSHGTSRPSPIHRSRKPYDIRDFDLITTTNVSYGHPWWHPGKGFLFLHTLYEDKGRSLYFNTSTNGRNWSKSQLLARVELGDYQITAHQADRTASVFNVHPVPLGLNARTNLYYVETRDMGKTWENAAGVPIDIPIRSVANAALVHDYQAEKRLVYLKELAFGNGGHPVILYLTSRGHKPGPAQGPHLWHTARWTGKEWIIREFTQSDHNYDFGALWIETDGTWRIIAPTEPRASPYTAGGDLVTWVSRNQGATWQRVRRLTSDPVRNHGYVRKPVNAHPDFYAIWADGKTLEPSASSLYYTNKSGTAVWRLPVTMTKDFEKPARLPLPRDSWTVVAETLRNGWCQYSCNYGLCAASHGCARLRTNGDPAASTAGKPAFPVSSLAPWAQLLKTTRKRPADGSTHGSCPKAGRCLAYQPGRGACRPERSRDSGLPPESCLGRSSFPPGSRSRSKTGLTSPRGSS